jgi:hypothetical protein
MVPAPCLNGAAEVFRCNIKVSFIYVKPIRHVGKAFGGIQFMQ